MSEPTVTPPVSGETAPASTTEPSATPQATGAVTEPEPKQPNQGAVTPPTVEEVNAQLEAERKERQKIEMERNQLRKKQDEAQAAADEARKAELTEVDRLKEELNQLQQDKDIRAARDFRNEVIDKYEDPATRDFAKALIAANEANLSWDESASDLDEAKAQLLTQLDAIKSKVSTGTPAEPATAASPKISPNNTAPTNEPPASREELIKKAAETRDFSDVFKTIPSVQAMVDSFKDDNQ